MQVQTIALILLAVVCAVQFMGCSSARIRKIDDKTVTEGLRFYRPMPYLLVHETIVKDETKISSEIVWLPDKSQEYVIQPTGRLGKSSLTVTLENGWNLTQFTLNRDAAPGEQLKQAAEGIGALAGVAAVGADTKLQPGLYRMSFNPDTGVLESLVFVEIGVK